MRKLILALLLTFGVFFFAGTESLRAQSTSIGAPPGAVQKWANFSAAVTSSTNGTVIAGVPGAHIIVLYAEFSPSGAAAYQFQEHPTTGSNLSIGTADTAATTPFPMPQDDFYGGGGYVTGAGSSVVLKNLGSSTVTLSGTVRYLLN